MYVMVTDPGVCKYRINSKILEPYNKIMLRTAQLGRLQVSKGASK